ncbi:unnamed protein product [Linum trigynum]|uniref:Uncharacterized protein n=1 Tax=Linum trigynum TaxID=586398 RepID=A0AAV2F6Z6_9ROSI
MGNCITVHHNSNKIASLSPQDDDNSEQLELAQKLMKIKRRKTTSAAPTRFSAVATEKKQKQKKSVRFVKRGDDDEEERGEDGRKRSPTTAAVRIRVLVTKNELREILKQHREELRSSSLEELVRAVKLREYRGRFGSKGRRMEDGGGNCEDGVWRPALETIPEDH